jgi:UDP-N-acetylmuramate dehydrogenase
MLSPAQLMEIRALMKGAVHSNAPLSRFTSFRIGGPAEAVAEPANVQDLIALLRYVQERRIPCVVIGAGTNVLFQDSGFRGVVVRTTGLGGFTVHRNGTDHARIIIGPGVGLPAVVSRTARLGWTGLEPLWGIPGSFGGAVVTNAGAGGVSLGDFLWQVKLVQPSGREIVLQKEDLRHEYRSMALPPEAVVVEGTLRLSRGEKGDIQAELEKARSRRRSSQPLSRPSAGCIFKNPTADKPAGAVIDRLGLKGAAVGDAQVSEIHANFIINRGRATCADVLELVQKIREQVRAVEKIDLELEIRVIGEGG